MKCRASLKTSKSGAAGGVKKNYIYYDLMTFLEETKDFEPTDESMASTSSQSHSQGVAAKSSQSDSQSMLPIEMTPVSASTDHTFEAPTRSSPKPWQKKKKKSMTEFESKLLNIIETQTSDTNPTSSTALHDDDCSFFNSLAPIINGFDIYKNCYSEPKYWN